MLTRLLLLIPLAFPQTVPTGGAITQYVPPVPTPASFISDRPSVLAPEAHAALDARIGAIQRAGLGDIAVAILPSIGDYSANQVAVEIYRTWRVGSVDRIGSARRNVGVLLLIVPRELAPNGKGECWINTGTGAEGIITDASAGTICRDSIIPHLRERDHAAAIGAGLSALEARLRGDAGLSAAGGKRGIVSPPRDSSSVTALVIGGVLALFAAAIAALKRWRRYHRRRCPRCGRMMRRVDETSDDARLEPGQVVEERLGSVDYDVWTCECGETLVLPYRAWFSKYSECRRCHRRAASHDRIVLTAATTVSSGLAEDRFECKACGERWTQTVTLPMIVATSSSSGGGGGGSSFGGSGSTSGGGGGGSC